jgi:zinc protease
VSGLPETQALDTGLTVVTLRHGATPLVSLRLGFPAGSAHAGPGQSGLAELTGQLLRRGCRGRSASAIDKALGELGVELGVWVDDDSTRLGLTVPSARLGPALELLLQLAATPTFPTVELSSMRRRTLASIRSGLDDAGSVAERALNRELFRGHAYERPIEGWSRELAKLGRREVAGFHARLYRAGGAFLIAAGGLPADAPRRLTALGGRLDEGTAMPGPGPTPAIGGLGVVVVDKPDATQAQIRIGAAGIAVQSPDLPACLLGNAVLGGGFSSRLVDEVRVKRGLAYGISSSLHSNPAGGVFAIRSSTRLDEAAALVRVALDEVDRLRDEGPTDAELTQASAYLRGSFQMANETGEQAASNLASALLQGFGCDWLERFPRLLAALSRADVGAAMQKHLPGPRRIVAVGPARKLAKALRKFGPVEVVTLSSLA